MKLFSVILNTNDFKAYHKGTLAPASKESIDSFVERMKLIGNEAFVLPPCEIQRFDGGDPSTDADETRTLFIIYVDIGTMAPVSAAKHMEQVRDTFANHPMMKQMVFLGRSAEGRGSSIEMIRI